MHLDWMINREIKRKIRWFHCMAWLIRPWLWSKEDHRCVDYVLNPDLEGENGTLTRLVCTCGKVFWKKS